MYQLHSPVTSAAVATAAVVNKAEKSFIPVQAYLNFISAHLQFPVVGYFRLLLFCFFPATDCRCFAVTRVPGGCMFGSSVLFFFVVH